MTDFASIARFGYDMPNPAAVGGFPTPYLTTGSGGMGGGVGASNPVGTYLQSAAAPVSPAIDISRYGLGAPTPYTTGAGPAATPAANGGKGFLDRFGGGIELALGGLQTIGSIWSAWEANKLAKDQFNFTKDFANTNLANQIQSYNTALEDRIRSRTVVEGGTDADAQAYIDKHSLRKRTV